MNEVPLGKRPSTFIEGRRHAGHMRERLRSDAALVATNGLPVPPEAFDYIFKLQVEVEKEGSMDYRKYAGKMWDRLARKQPDDHGFPHFESAMIRGLHDIDMKAFVYPDLIESMPELFELYGQDVRSIAIWSTGDVSATGYQPGKIERSRIIQEFLSMLGKRFQRAVKSEIVREKTAYLVDDNKYERLVEYTSQFVEEDGEKPVKLVIIEDSLGSFGKAEKILEERLGEGSVEVIPIWFTGSREGKNAQKKVNELKGTETYEEARYKLEKQKEELNAIGSFEELLDQGRFGEIFREAHVMVDFDGVICDNIGMRVEQANVIYNSLLHGVSVVIGGNVEEASELVLANLAELQS